MADSVRQEIARDAVVLVAGTVLVLSTLWLPVPHRSEVTGSPPAAICGMIAFTTGPRTVDFTTSARVASPFTGMETTRSSNRRHASPSR